MKHFVLKTEPDKDGVVRLEGKDFHYLTRVRRLATGESFPAILPNGEEVLIEIISVNSKIMIGKPKASLLNSNSSSSVSRTEGSTCREPKVRRVNNCVTPPLILLQALPKADKMDIIVRQAAESGISEIVPFTSQFSVAKTTATGQKFIRWERIIKEARQQSGSKTATKLHKPLAIDDVINYWQDIRKNGGFGLLFHHRGLEQNSLHGYLDSEPKTVAFAIGPEGGFSDTEVSLFLENGFKPLTIGNTVLRTETAALYCAAAIRITLLERETWQLRKT